MLDRITHLFRFRVIIEEGSLRRAAEKLNVTQPALSRSIAQMERHFGQPLLERHARGVLPTTFGELVLSSALRLGRHWEIAEEDLKTGASGKSGRLRIRCGPLWQAVVLPKIIGRLQTVFPDLIIEMLNSRADRDVKDLIEGRSDVLFGGLQVSDGVDQRLAIRQFTTVRDRVVARQNHPILSTPQRNSRIRPGAVLDYPWLVYTADPNYGNATVHATLERIGGSPDIRITCESLASAIGLLQNSDCLAILPDAAVAETNSPRIIPIPVSLGRRTIRSGATFRVEMADWPPLKELMRLCQERFD